MEPSLLEIHGLNKSFGKTSVLRQINLNIYQGKIFALLGPNGAGKTTLIRCLLKLIPPDEGEILFKTKPLLTQDIHRYFGYLPEAFQLYRELCGRELLNILGLSLNLKPQNLGVVLEWVGLKDEQDKKIKAYSRGMLQRLGLAICLLKDPEVIVLDEPIAGLDPLGQIQILQLLKNLNNKGKTIFFSSHILSQVEKVSDYIGIIHKGTLRFVGKLNEFLNKHRSSSLEDAFLREIQQ